MKKVCEELENLLLKTGLNALEDGFSSVKTDLADGGLWVEIFNLVFQNFDFLFDDFDFVSQKVFAFALELFNG